MGNVERGQQVPSLKMVERIAHELNVAPKALFDFVEVSAETEDKERVHLYEALFAELPICTPDDLRVLIQVAKQLGSKLLNQQS